jgi:hypothetical protein
MLNVKKIRIQFIGIKRNLSYYLLEINIKFSNFLGYSPSEKIKFDDKSDSNGQANNLYFDLTEFDNLPLVENIDSIKCCITRSVLQG